MRVSLSLQILGNILQAELMDGGKCLMHNKVGPHFFFLRERGVSRGGGGLQCILCQASHNQLMTKAFGSRSRMGGGEETAQPCLPVTS